MEQVYIDMDGVVADFDLGIRGTYGCEYKDIDQAGFWNEDIATKKFYENLPTLTAGMEMVRMIAEDHPVCFLTSTGGGRLHNEIARQKLLWLRTQGLGQHAVIFCLDTAQKGMFVQPGAILIDDRQKACDAWEAAGGYAMQYTCQRSLLIVSHVMAAMGREATRRVIDKATER